MTEQQKNKVEPWQLVTILIVLVALFGGMYLMNETINARLEVVQSNVTAKTEVLINKLDALKADLNRVTAKADEENDQLAVAQPAPTPAAQPAPEEAAAEEEERDAEEPGKEPTEKK